MSIGADFNNNENRGSVPRLEIEMPISKGGVENGNRTRSRGVNAPGGSAAAAKAFL